MSSCQRFSAPWATSLKILTAIVLMILAAMAIVGIAALPPKTPPLARWLLVIAPALIFAGTLPFAVRGYEIDERELRIVRLGWMNRIPRAEIVSALADKTALNGSLRLCGSGGFLGWFGFFWSKRLGVYRAYCTSISRCVIVRLTNRTLVVSPEPPDQFLAALNVPQFPG